MITQVDHCRTQKWVKIRATNVQARCSNRCFQSLLECVLACHKSTKAGGGRLLEYWCAHRLLTTSTHEAEYGGGGFKGGACHNFRVHQKISKTPATVDPPCHCLLWPSNV